MYHGGMSLPPGQASGNSATRTDWSSDQHHSMERVVEHLVETVLADNIAVVGLSGAPGCGKSTLAHILVNQLATKDIDALVLSLDNYYFGKLERMESASIHPLFTQRGVPGTHDWDQLINDLDRLMDGDTSDLLLPRFDKMSDDRLPGGITVPNSPRVIVLEGWVIGAPPQDQENLAKPVNSIESDRDKDGRWRSTVNDHLEKYDLDLRDRIDAFCFMSPPGWKHVIDWRWQQEQQNARSESGGFLRSREAVLDFLDPFQRLADHMMNTAEQWADVIIDIDENHLLSIRD